MYCIPNSGPGRYNGDKKKIKKIKMDLSNRFWLAIFEFVAIFGFVNCSLK